MSLAPIGVWPTATLTTAYWSALNVSAQGLLKGIVRGGSKHNKNAAFDRHRQPNGDESITGLLSTPVLRRGHHGARDSRGRIMA